MAQQQPARRKMHSAKTPVSIPDKLYFRIGDVASLCSLPAYVLRFWETEFPQLKPHKGGSGQRLYRKRDVEMVLAIKHLLYDEGFTIAGARRSLAEKRATLSVGDPHNQAEPPHPMRRRSDMETQPVKMGRTAGIAAVGSKRSPQGPKFNELRKEMRALLSMLGSQEQQNVIPPAATIRRRKKSLELSSEPTLF